MVLCSRHAACCVSEKEGADLVSKFVWVVDHHCQEEGVGVRGVVWSWTSWATSFLSTIVYHKHIMLNTESEGSTRFRNPRTVVVTTERSEVVT